MTISKSKNKKTSIEFRCNKEQKVKIKKDAKSLNMTTSKYILYLCENNNIKIKYIINPDDKYFIEKSISSLNKQVGLLKTIYSNFNGNKDLIFSEQSSRILNDISDIIHNLLIKK